jgi:hypothetical protein
MYHSLGRKASGNGDREKPCSHNTREGELLVAAATKHKNP